MNTFSSFTLALSLGAAGLASCALAQDGESPTTTAEEAGFTQEEMGTFEQPWAIEFLPGRPVLAITEKAGTLKMMQTRTGEIIEVSGVPEVAYGGQGGLGDVAFLESEAERRDARTIYLSWAEQGEADDTYGAVVGKGLLKCDNAANACNIEGMEVIWRQSPKVPGRGHYSHRLAFSPDEKYLFVASGDRQKQTPAQDMTNTLGSIVRVNLDGSPAAGNPFADQDGVPDEIWSYGHRNILGLDFAPDGTLWEVEHGPAGGDELNVVARANNYGWPTRSYGDNYNGTPIPDHTPDDGFTKPAIHWTPVIAPGDMLIYSGEMFAPWAGDALIPGLKTQALIHVDLDGGNAKEVGRYELGGRLRSVAQGPDGSIWVVEDGKDAKLFKLSM
jgi:glucose/arabinose dehydrogenase